MQSLNACQLVDQMTSELAARRRVMVGRRAAYLALARVILSSDEPSQETGSRELEPAAA
jgi:hypothetical protein